jgi:predicted RNA-binding protein (virulence factor B family)
MLTEKKVSAEDRFWEFSKKFKQPQLTKQLNARTKKMKNIAKVKEWFRVLEDQNFHEEAELALAKLKELGGSL